MIVMKARKMMPHKRSSVLGLSFIVWPFNVFGLTKFCRLVEVVTTLKNVRESRYKPLCVVFVCVEVCSCQVLGKRPMAARFKLAACVIQIVLGQVVGGHVNAFQSSARNSHLTYI